MGRPQGCGRSRFDFSSGGNDSLSCTADQGIGAECRAECMRERIGLIGMLGGDKQEGDINAGRAQLFTNRSDQLVGCSLHVGVTSESGGEPQC